MRCLRRLVDLRVGRVRARERDVVAQRPVEHRRVLRYVGDQAAQIRLAQLADVLPADQDPAVVEVHHPQQQAGQGALATA